MIPIELLTKYNMVSLEQYKNDFDDSKEIEKRFYEMFLMQTNHIVDEIVESLIENLATATLVNFASVVFNFLQDVRKTYKEELTYRKFARAEIARLSE